MNQSMRNHRWANFYKSHSVQNLPLCTSQAIIGPSAPPPFCVQFAYTRLPSAHNHQSENIAESHYVNFSYGSRSNHSVRTPSAISLQNQHSDTRCLRYWSHPIQKGRCGSNMCIKIYKCRQHFLQLMEKIHYFFSSTRACSHTVQYSTAYRYTPCKPFFFNAALLFKLCAFSLRFQQWKVFFFRHCMLAPGQSSLLREFRLHLHLYLYQSGGETRLHGLERAPLAGRSRLGESTLDWQLTAASRFKQTAKSNKKHNKLNIKQASSI